MHRRLLDWLEERTGIEGAIKHFLYEEIPASSGWHQVLGSVALFAFLVQVVTGILLALNYAPTPVAAYDSVRYIMTQVTAGRLMRALHHWGASLMIVVVVLHMIQTFVWGAYKKPREATWIAGVHSSAADLGLWTQRVSAAVGQPRVLGHGGDHGNLSPGARRGSATGSPAGQRRHLDWRDHLHAILRGARAASAAAHRVADRAPRLSGAAARRGARRPRTKICRRRSFIPSRWRKTRLRSFGWFAVLMGMAILARVPLGHMADPDRSKLCPAARMVFPVSISVPEIV